MKREPMIASDGMWLTDGILYAKKIFLEVGRNPDDFYEISEEEYNRIIEEESSYEDE